MKNLLVTICMFLAVFQANAQFYKTPFAHTYSVVAMDENTGDMGAAVQSHWFATGAVVIWGEAGVGVVATQSFVNISFGMRGIELLKLGYTPQQTIDTLLATDSGREFRQLAILNSKGEVAAFTGKNCITEAGHVTDKNFSVQANMMLKNTVWNAMATSFKKNNKLPLAERMLATLKAAQAEGGDIRGMQSAAILVVRAKPTGNKWEDVLVNIRVDDHTTPLVELDRLLNVHNAYNYMNEGDLAIEKKDMQLAKELYAKAETLYPNNEEMKYWQAVSLANMGNLAEALPMFKIVFAKNENWRDLTKRLVPVKLLTVSDTDLQKILKQ